jgi:hypothetical protein
VNDDDGPGLLASPWFWGGAFLCLLFWAGLAWLVLT